MIDPTAETLDKTPSASGELHAGDGPATALRTGTRIDRYVVLSPLGAGAMGLVLAAYDPQLDRKVAIKLLKRRSDPESRGQSRLQREAQALARLDHRNVVTIHDVGVHNGQLFIAMEFVAGQTLREWMTAQPPRPWREILAVFLDAGRGLAAAHDAGLVHRDFKPDNVMIGDDGQARVMDFGLARVATSTAPLPEPNVPTTTEPPSGDTRPSPLLDKLTQTGALIGTPAYMAPEQFSGQSSDVRTDQFSFCVALYEALYGARPFPTTSLATYMSAVQAERLEAKPSNARIPARLYRVITRGLAKTPAERWPSMDALLAALADDPRRRWRRRATAGLTLATLGVGVLGVVYSVQREQRACAAMDTHLQGIWDPPRRAAVRAAIDATGLSFAADTGTRLERGLDDYTQRWLAARVEACEATQRGEQSGDLLDLRMACLDERLEHVKATVHVFTEADTRVVEAAAKAIADLPRIERCTNFEALTAELPPPEDPVIAARVAELNHQIIEARALSRTGKYADGLAQILTVTHQAAQLEHPPLEVRASLLEGQLRRQTGDFEGAEAALEHAYSGALRSRLARESARASTKLMVLLGRHLVRHEDARRWSRHAEPLAQAEGSDEILAEYYNGLGLVAASEGLHVEARSHHEQALALREHVYGPDHPKIANALNNLGFVAKEQGQYSKARAHYERALAISQSSHGVDHPETAALLYNLGSVAKRAGDLDAAQRYHEQALSIRERALGLDHPDLAGSLNSLASVAKSKGDFATAHAYFERALSIFEATFGSEHPYVAGVLNNLGSTAKRLGDHRAAREYFQRALTLSERELGPEHPSVGQILYNLGNFASSIGDYRSACEYFQRALAIYDRSVGSTHPMIAYTATYLGYALLERGDTTAAMAYLERALALLDAGEFDPTLLADARFCLARALWEAPPAAGRDRARALDLAERAREAYLASTQSEALEQLGLLEAWLASRP